MSSTTPITRRIAASVASLFALAATVVVAPAASAAPSDASFVAPNAGYNGVYGGTDAAQSFIFDVEGTDVKAFCVEFNKELNRDAAFTTASLTSGLGEAAWIAANHTSVGTPLSDVNAENAAAAIAIWHYTDSIDITTPVPEELGIRDRVDELVAAAAGKSVTPGPSGFDLDLEASFDSGTDEVTATATFTTTSGTPVAGADVVFHLPDGSDETVETDASGVASVTVADPEEGTEVEVGAEASGVLPAGTLLVPADGSQILVTSDPVTVTRQATASVDVPAPTTTTEPEPTTTTTMPDPTTTTTMPDPTTTQPTLPRTGPGALSTTVVAISAGAAGALGYLTLRARRHD